VFDIKLLISHPEHPQPQRARIRKRPSAKS
jgi:hypothetical protein